MAITKAELQDKYDTLLAEHNDMQVRLLTVASQAAFEHDLCKVLDETLAKVGIKVPTVEVTVETTKTYEIPMTVASRVGFIDPDTDDDTLKARVESALLYGVLNADWNEDEEDFGIPDFVDPDPIVTSITVKQPVLSVA